MAGLPIWDAELSGCGPRQIGAQRDLNRVVERLAKGSAEEDLLLIRQ